MRLLLISSSIVHGYGFLDYNEADIRRFFAGTRRVSFIPYSQKDHHGYTTQVRDRFERLGIDVVPVEQRADIESAEAVFIGGGNTFRLLFQLYERNLLEPIRARVRAGMPYLGSSAGTNAATPTIKTTNDMPIVRPPSFDALGLVHFQINPHYLDADPSSTHHGETREQRIKEFHEENATPVAGLREGSALLVENGAIILLGDRTLRLFRRGQPALELEPGTIVIPAE